MEIIVFDHNANISGYRKRYEELCKFKDVKLTLVIPKYLDYYNGVKTPDAILENAQYETIILENTKNGKVHRGFYTDIIGLIKLLKKQPDIIYIFAEPEAFYALQIICLARMFSKNSKIILTTFININYYKTKYPYQWSFLYKWVYKYNIKRVHGIMTNTKIGFEMLRENGFKGRIAYEGLGVDLTQFRKKDVNLLKSNLKLNGFVVGFIGRIEYEKGLDTLIKAISLIKNNITVLIVGDGSYKNEIIELAKKHNVNLIVTKAVSHGGVADYYNCMDVFVLPSRTMSHWKEQFGRVLIEAMACGIPVIGSNSGEISNVISNAGLIFNEGDENDLSKNIVKLMKNDSLRNELIKLGKEHVGQNYTWDRIALKLYGMCQDLVS